MSHYRWNFDVRNTIPGYRHPEPDNEKLYSHINAMCYLLDAVPYRVLYGPVKTFAGVLHAKLDPNHIATSTLEDLFGRQLIPVLRSGLKRIVDDGHSANVVLRTFYEGPVQDGTDEAHVLTEFRGIDQVDKQDEERLCMPFLEIQDSGNFIKKSDMAAHIALIGNYSLMDIYTRSQRHYPDLHQAVEHGYDKDILRRPGSADESAIGLMIFNPINNKKCNPDGTGCMDAPGYWCNIDSNGNCTTGSM